MGTLSNLLTGRTHDFLGGTGSWAFLGAEPHEMGETREQIKFDSLGSLKVTAGSDNPIILEHTRVSMDDQYDWDSRAFYWIYSNEPLTATIGLIVYNSTTESASATVSVRARRWTLVSVAGVAPESSARIKMVIRIDDLSDGDSAYVTNPVIITPNAISRNIFAAESWLRLPGYLQEADELQEDPDFPLLRFLDVITSEPDAIYAIWEAMRYIPPDDEDGEDLSSLDPEEADLPTLRWWAQLLGVRFYDPSTGTTSWVNLEEGLDEDSSGEAEWDEWETVPDGGDVGSDASWAEIEGFRPTVSGLSELLRWQIQTAYFGLRGGTLEAVVESVKKVLTGDKYTNVVYHPGGDPWAVKVQTKQSETPDEPDIGESSASVTEIVANAVPAGYEFIHETIAD